MRALVLHQPAPASHGPLREEEIADPRPAGGELLLEVKACGVCRTDLHIVEGELVPPSYPVVPGHQVVGRVLEAGSATEGFEQGDRVGVAWVARFCGVCEYCRDGRENLCLSPTFTGFHRPGGFAERITVPAAFAHPIPGTLGDDVHVAPLLCAGIIGYRALKQSGLRPGRSIALYGFGAAAHIALQVARHWDCETFVVTRDRDGVERAKRMGADWAGLSGEPLPHPVQHAVTFAPVGSVIPPAMEGLKRGGTLSIAGIYLDRVPGMDYEKHFFQEKAIVSTTANTREDARELLQLAAEGAFHSDVTTFPLSGANEALQRLKEGTLGAQAGVLDLARR